MISWIEVGSPAAEGFQEAVIRSTLDRSIRESACNFIFDPAFAFAVGFRPTGRGPSAPARAWRIEYSLDLYCR